MYDKLTENDIKKMQEEIDYRKLVVRPKELEAVKEARAQGDLSENFEYKAAKQLTLFQIPQRTTKLASTIPFRFTSKKMMRQKPTNLSPPFVVILSKDTSVSTRH